MNDKVKEDEYSRQRQDRQNACIVSQLVLIPVEFDML
jgi:hypothetical protein